TDFRFPYGRRDMVLPVWAHKRGKQYGLAVMGGKPGNSPASCQAGGVAPAECDDTTIGYHFTVSSPESFYCSPRGGVNMKLNGADVVSCASGFYGSKGAYADPPAYSLYPPRSDLTSFVLEHDGDDARAFSSVNDLGAVSGATPPGNQLVDPPIRWRPPHDGNYVMMVEVSQEADFNMFHRYPSLDDKNVELNGYGHDFLGQPSVVYAVPFRVGDELDVELMTDYAGYGDWDGASGTLHGPDMTIATVDGSGAGRLLLTSDASGGYRVKVRALPVCTGGGPTCAAPGPPSGLKLLPKSAALEVSFSSAVGGQTTARFDVRYRETPITEADFLTAVPSSNMPPAPGVPGSTVQTAITGLRPETKYFVAVRALAMCDAASPIVTGEMTTAKANYVTLNGCFIATAAYGTPLAGELDALRRLRDRHLLSNPAGRLAVAVYYAFSPPVARAIATDDHLRAAVRRLVAPLVRASVAP
ncbi:MAG TPA: CFI-box-CTERM domain-containing protein, partial [Kofleriaceae bacterium]|nr:CFI-box-CTERM domain-containing protein [Kofleriaceae bacterium]